MVAVSRLSTSVRSVFLLLLLLLPVTGIAQQDFREETIYFLITTRFFDGDPSNNVPNEWSSYNPDPNINPSITDPQDVTWRGDFKGLIQKLDYIRDLGFTAIWITPIVQNRSPLDYHGYHAYDFTKVDPRLESPGATFQDLIDEVHARDMKIILDIVTNHSGRFGIKGQAEIMYNRNPAMPWGQAADGSPLPDATTWAYDGMTPNPADGKIWSMADVPRLPAPWNENLAAYNFPSSVSYLNTTSSDWFHHSGNGFAQGFDDTENLQNRALHEDTPDLNTGSPVLRQYLFNAYKTFIEMGVDGFRWDTIKHMSREDVIWFLDAFRSVKPDLFVVGEVAQKRHELHNVEETNPHWYTWRGAVGSSQPSGMTVFDFYAMGTFHMFNYGGRSMSEVQAAARYDHLYADPTQLVTFLDNHDFGPNNDWNKRFGGTDRELAAAMNFMFTWRGIPSVYYGTEMMFRNGYFNDIQHGGHQRSINETGRAYYGDVIDQAPNHVIYAHIRKLNAMRRAVPALQKGTYTWGGNGGGNGVGYIRAFGESYAVVGLAKDGSVNFNFSGIRNGTYRDAVTGHEVTVSNGSLAFTVAPSSAGVYVLNGPGRVGDLGAGFFQTDANGSQGSGGGGGTTNPATTLGFNPDPPVAGQPVTITYDGFLKSQSAVNLHWGVNGWTGVGTTAMTKSGDVWTATITPPAHATVLNFVFNNGAGTWDNNNQADYSKPVAASGGGDPVPPTPQVFAVDPDPPVAGRSLTLTYTGTLASGSAVNLHWGRNNWQDVTTIAMAKVAGVWSVTLNLPVGTTMLDFVFNNGAGTWDNNSNQDYHVQVVAPTSAEAEREDPVTTALLGNWPNPFNPGTLIQYRIAGGTQPVILAVYDLLGRELVRLVDATQAPGVYTVPFTAESAWPSGVYLYRLQTGTTVRTGKMLYVK